MIQDYANAMNIAAADDTNSKRISLLSIEETRTTSSSDTGLTTATSTTNGCYYPADDDGVSMGSGSMEDAAVKAVLLQANDDRSAAYAGHNRMQQQLQQQQQQREMNDTTQQTVQQQYTVQQPQRTAPPLQPAPIAQGLPHTAGESHIHSPQPLPAATVTTFINSTILNNTPQTATNDGSTGSTAALLPAATGNLLLDATGTDNPTTPQHVFTYTDAFAEAASSDATGGVRTGTPSPTVGMGSAMVVQHGAQPSASRGEYVGVDSALSNKNYTVDESVSGGMGPVTNNNTQQLGAVQPHGAQGPTPVSVSIGVSELFASYEEEFVQNLRQAHDGIDSMEFAVDSQLEEAVNEALQQAETCILHMELDLQTIPRSRTQQTLIENYRKDLCEAQERMELRVDEAKNSRFDLLPGDDAALNADQYTSYREYYKQKSRAQRAHNNTAAASSSSTAPRTQTRQMSLQEMRRPGESSAQKYTQFRHLDNQPVIFGVWHTLIQALLSQKTKRYVRRKVHQHKTAIIVGLSVCLLFMLTMYVRAHNTAGIRSVHSTNLNAHPQMMGGLPRAGSQLPAGRRGVSPSSVSNLHIRDGSLHRAGGLPANNAEAGRRRGGAPRRRLMRFLQ